MDGTPEDPPPARAEAVVFPGGEDARDDFLAALQQVVLTDIRTIEAEHAAAEQVKVRLFVKLDIIVLPFAIGLFIWLQLINKVVFAEMAGLVPNGGLFILRVVKHVL